MIVKHNLYTGCWLTQLKLRRISHLARRFNLQFSWRNNEKKPFSTNNVRCPLLFFPLAQQTDDFDRMTFFFFISQSCAGQLEIAEKWKKTGSARPPYKYYWDFLMSIRAERSVLCAGLARLSPIWLYGVSRSPRCSSPAWVFSFSREK